MFVAAVVALLWFSDKSEREEQRATLISDMLWLEQNLRFVLTHNEELLGRFDSQRIDLPEIFDTHARTLIANNTGIYQVIWLDREGKTRHAMPAPSDSVMVGEGQTTLPSTSSSRLARSLGNAVYSPAYPIIQGDWQFEVHLPIFRGGQFIGTAVGIYSIRRLLGESVPWWLAERYRITVVDQANQQLGIRTKSGDVAPDSEYQIIFDPPGHGLILRAAPYRVPTPLASRLITAALILLAVLVLLSQWALRRHVQHRLTAESALKNEFAFRKAMEDSVQTGLRARTLDGQITYVNPAFCRMVGWSADELIGHTPPMPYWAEEYLDETKQLHALVLAGKAPAEGFEIRFKRHDGQIFDALIHEAPLIDNGGHQTGWMGSIVDITEHKRIAELGRQQEERLQASARLISMGEMASSLAHELNQPLSAISSYTTGCRNLIASGASMTELDTALMKCQEQAQRAGRIIRRIYEFVRRHEPKSEDCDIDTLLNDLLTLIEADARRQHVRLVRKTSAILPILQADRVLLGQAILNLMKNGIESMRDTQKEQRSLTISSCLTDQHVVLSFADHGSGISSEDTDQLFQPFYTTKNEGLGVGLNICRSVVEAHQGRLWFESNPEGGTIFFITLPVKK
jgi:two-component system sensor histidine kinase DctS